MSKVTGNCVVAWSLRPYCGYDYSEWLMLPSRDARVINENETDYSGDAFITYDDGRIYNGDVFDGRPDGAGVMKLLDGRIISALWLDGEPLESMIVTWPNGSRLCNWKAFLWYAAWKRVGLFSGWQLL